MAATAVSGSTTVYVSNLSATTTKESLEKFLGFCGKVDSIDLKTDQTATVVFEKEASAKTAEFLNGGTLDGSTIKIVGPSALSASEASTSATPTTAGSSAHDEHEHEHPGQHDKPRSAIAAEYLAHGYLLGDNVLQQGIAMDQKYGISTKFLSYWGKINQKLQPTVQPHINKAAETARTIDEKGGYSQKATAAANSAWAMSQAYYEKALASPYGQKVHSYYTTGAKTVLEVHEEALRIAELRKAHSRHGSADVGHTDASAGGAAGKAPETDHVHSSGPTPVAATEVKGTQGQEVAATSVPT